LIWFARNHLSLPEREFETILTAGTSIYGDTFRPKPFLEVDETAGPVFALQRIHTFPSFRFQIHNPFLTTSAHFEITMKAGLIQLLTLFSATSAFAPQIAMTSRIGNAATLSRTTFASSTLDTNDETEVENLSSEDTLAMQMKAQEMEVRMEGITNAICT